MNLGINTITKRLFFSFGMLVFTIIVISSLSLLFINRTRSIHQVIQQIDNERVLIVQLIKTDLDFLRFETLNESFYSTASIPLLVYRDSLSEFIKHQNRLLYTRMAANKFLIDYEFRKLDSMLIEYNATFALLTQKIKERGYKDHGLEGRMREYAHNLESIHPPPSLNQILMLRRHEKDFLLRKETAYIDHFNSLADSVMKTLEGKANREASHLLTEYRNAFNTLTALNIEIGIHPNEGLLGQLNKQTNAISAGLQQLTILSNKRSEKVIKESVISFALVSLFTICFSVVLTYYTSTRLARPIKKLSDTIGKFMVSEGLDEKDLENGDITNEINALAQSFITLSRTLKAQFNEIEHKSELLEAQNQELKKLNEELDRFIYSAAHDLKSPLASLEGLIRLAEREINSPGYNHYFHMMHSSVKKLDGFIRDITDYAKNKRQDLKTELIDLKKVVEEILNDLRFLPHANLIRTTIHIGDGDIVTDKTRLEIILKNLLSNAFRYLDLSKSQPRIEIVVDVQDKEVSIRISDNGIGIDSEHIPKIFQMFYRAVEHSKGTGIGLFLVKESVKMLRGKIGVHSILGEGTTFYLNIPNFKCGNTNIPESEALLLPENI